MEVLVRSHIYGRDQYLSAWLGYHVSGEETDRNCPALGLAAVLSHFTNRIESGGRSFPEPVVNTNYLASHWNVK